MPEELYRIQDLCFQNDQSLLLDHLNLYQYKGETLGLMGLHDSGKTLLARILSGQLTAVTGHFYYEEASAPLSTLAANVVLIQKNSALIPSLSVMENIFVIRNHRHNSLLVHKKLMLGQTLSWMKEFGLSIPPQKKVSQLTKNEQYLVELIKAYILGAKLIVLDDIPFAFLQTPEFTRIITYMKEKSVSFLITACDMNPLHLFSDRIYFMADHRAIKWVYNEKRHAIDVSALYSKPIIYREFPSQVSGEIALEVDRLDYKTLREISFSIHEGEIVSIFDLFRNASSELLEALFHANRYRAGSISLYGQPVSEENRSSLVDVNFEFDDIIFEMLSTRDNICINNYRKFARPLGILKKSQMQYVEHNFLAEYAEEGFQARSACHRLSKKEKLAIYLYRYELLRKKVLFFIYPERYIDYETSYIFKNALKRIAGNRNTVCIITCDFDKIYQLASRHLILSTDSIHEFTKDS